MMFTNTVSLLLALAPATLFAAPTGTTVPTVPAPVEKAVLDSVCDVSHLTMLAAPTPLPPPSAGLKLSHLAVGRGTQNYTCATNTAASAPVQIGAWAWLYNITCNEVRTPSLNYTSLAYQYQPPFTGDVADQLLSGHHEFTAAGSPYFNLDTTNGQYGTIVAKKNNTSNAPWPTEDVPWLKLVQTEGDIKEVYRIETVGGVAPATCAGKASSFYVDYAAKYYFWK